MDPVYNAHKNFKLIQTLCKLQKCFHILFRASHVIEFTFPQFHILHFTCVNSEMAVLIC